MNVVFLDYDGVVNTPMWDDDGKHCLYNFPKDDKVNNFQAVQWVSEFCQKFDYKIVVTSTWRLHSNYVDCLKNGGLRDGIEVLGRTVSLPLHSREEEIQQYLDEHPDIDNFIILDDDTDFDNLIEHWIDCNSSYGFMETEFIRASRLHQKLLNERMVNAKEDHRDEEI